MGHLRSPSFFFGWLRIFFKRYAVAPLGRPRNRCLHSRPFCAGTKPIRRGLSCGSCPPRAVIHARPRLGSHPGGWAVAFGPGPAMPAFEMPRLSENATAVAPQSRPTKTQSETYNGPGAERTRGTPSAPRTPIACSHARNGRFQLRLPNCPPGRETCLPRQGSSNQQDPGGDFFSRQLVHDRSPCPKKSGEEPRKVKADQAPSGRCDNRQCRMKQ